MNKPDIVKVLAHYGCNVRTNINGWQKIKCPFHPDRHASAGVSTTDNLFVCHGCGVKGNGFNIISSEEGVNFREAIKIAEGLTGEVYSNVSSVNKLGRRVSNETRNQSRGSSSNSIRSRRESSTRTRRIS